MSKKIEQAQQTIMTPGEILEEAAKAFGGEGGLIAQLYVDAHTQGNFSTATGGRVLRLPWPEFDEGTIQDKIRAVAGAGVYVLTLRAPGMQQYLVRVPGFHIPGLPGAGAPIITPAAHTPSGMGGGGQMDFLTFVMNQQSQQNMQFLAMMKGIFDTIGSNRGQASSAPSLTELAAIIPKPSSLSEQVQTMTMLQTMIAKMQKGLPPGDGGDVDHGDLLTRGLLTILENIGASSKEKEKGSQRTHSAAAASSSSTVPPAPTAPTTTPAGTAAAALPPRPQTAEEAIVHMLVMFAGRDPVKIADSLAPFIDDVSFQYEVSPGQFMPVDGWMALERAPDKVLTHFLEKAPALVAHREWVQLVITELTKEEEEEPNAGTE